MEKIMSTLSAASPSALLRWFRPHRSSLAATLLGFGGVFVAGVAVGAVAGLMFAPKSGRDLRADLKSGAKNVGTDLRHTATTLSSAAKRVVSAVEVPHQEETQESAGAPH